MNELAIGTKDLAKTYASIRAVNGINLTVPRGSIYGFLGRNGAGKTTTIKMLLGLVRPTAGSARVLGMDTLCEHIAILQRTAFVSEKKTLYPSLTPSELVRFSRGFYPTWSGSAVEKYARLFEIPMKQRFEQLSNGNQTKVWLLLALCQGADLLILDEPTTALDPITVDQLMHVLAEDALDRGCTIFFSSHQLEEVERALYWTTKKFVLAAIWPRLWPKMTCRRTKPERGIVIWKLPAKASRQQPTNGDNLGRGRRHSGREGYF